jgi:hypothetical protein
VSRGKRFFIVFAIQGVITYVFVKAVGSNDNMLMGVAVGAAVMTFVLMLIIWLMSVISSNDIK